MPRFEVTMKPAGMTRSKHGRRRPEYACTVDADDRADACAKARESASANGFDGYAITEIKEKTQ